MNEPLYMMKEIGPKRVQVLRSDQGYTEYAIIPEWAWKQLKAMKERTMARFYGSVQGSRGEATRLGHGVLNVTAQSWQGDIVVTMRKDDTGNEQRDYVYIAARKHGSVGEHVCLYAGRVSDLITEEGRNRIVLNLAEEMLRKDAENAAAKTVTAR